MADRKITIQLRARNAMAAGIASGYKALQSFGRSAVNIGKWFARGFMVAGAAVVGFAVKAITAYAAQEKAERALASSINAYGENAAAALPKLKAIAAAIQDETGAADENTLASMARLKMAGVQTAQLEAAAKAVVALKSRNIEGAAAERLVANALEGNFMAWGKVIPKIKNASSEAEKAALVNEFLTSGYANQKDQLGTVAGAWAALKGRMGDAWEEAGKAISQNGMLADVITRAGDAVKSFGARIAEWASSGGVETLVFGVKTFAEESGYRFKSVGLGFVLMWSALSDGAKTAFNYVTNLATTWKDATVEQFKYVADWAVAVWDKIKSPGSAFQVPSAEPMKKAANDFLAAALAKDALVSESTKKTLQEIESLNVAHFNELERLEKEHLAKLTTAADKRVTVEKKANEKIVVAAVSHRKKMEELLKARESAATANVEKLKDAEEKANKAAEDSAEGYAKKRELFLSKDAQVEERAKEKQAARELRQIKLAASKLDSFAYRRGRLSGKGLERAAAARAAEKDMKATAQEAAKITAARQKAEDDLKQATLDTAKYTKKISEDIGDALSPAEG